MEQSFGGSWTDRKLIAVEKYLRAYTTLMRSNVRAKHFTITYLDGFAGSGRGYQAAGSLFEGLDNEADEFYVGSALRALRVSPPFDHYVFVDEKAGYLEMLRETIQKSGEGLQDCQFHRSDVNSFLPKWISQLGPLDRAVVFLDPYGMQIEWKTVSLIGSSQKVDLWILIPLGQALIRMMPKTEPPESWAARLTTFLGTDEWREAFYPKSQQETLFGIEEITVRRATVECVTKFLIQRLKTAFYGVHDSPLVLENSRGVPLYLLCFAAGNPKGAKPALKIAGDLIRSGMK